MKKKITTVIGATGALLASLPLLLAFESHVINVTADIANGILTVPAEITYGTVFPQEKIDRSFQVSLSESFLGSLVDTPELLVNGGFEAPIVVNGAQWDIFPSGTPGLGWAVEWQVGQPTTFITPPPRPAVANLELHRGVAGWLPQSGAQYTELDTDWFGPSSGQSGEPALVKIYQDIATTPGVQYDLSYWFSPRPGQGVGQNVLLVRIGGVQVGNHSDAGGAQTSWTNFVQNFIATTTLTRVEFEAGGTPDSLGVFLDNVSFIGRARNGRIEYMIRQKPKCGLPVPATSPVQYSDFEQVTGENLDGTFICPIGYVPLPLLCPYLSKHEVETVEENPDNDSAGINAFHGLPLPWTLATAIATQVNGVLDANLADESDNWVVDLRVPCFKGACAQDWPNFIRAESGNTDIDVELYKADPLLEHEIFGCDLWVEVNLIE